MELEATKPTNIQVYMQGYALRSFNEFDIIPSM